MEWQLRVAAGERIPISQDEILNRGKGRFAMEARICAEGATKEGFSPSAGTLTALNLPRESEWLRVDTGVNQFDVIQPYFDSMIAKIICSSDVSREEARSRLDQALASVKVSGVYANVTFLRALLNDKRFVSGTMTTDYVEKNMTPLMDWCDALRRDAILVAAAGVYGRHKLQLGPGNVWGSLPNHYESLRCDGKPFQVQEDASGAILVEAPLEDASQSIPEKISGKIHNLEQAQESESMVKVNDNTYSASLRWDHNQKMVDVFLNGRRYSFSYDSKQALL